MWKISDKNVDVIIANIKNSTEILTLREAARGIVEPGGGRLMKLAKIIDAKSDDTKVKKAIDYMLRAALRPTAEPNSIPIIIGQISACKSEEELMPILTYLNSLLAKAKEKLKSLKK